MVAFRILPIIAAALFAAPASSFVPPSAFPNQRSSLSAEKSSALKAGEVAVIVEADVVPERIDEFLELIEADAIGSRKEPGCIRFDVMRSNDDPNKFFFYEVYESAEAVAYHKAQPYFQPWTAFKESGGVTKSVSKVSTGLFMQ